MNEFENLPEEFVLEGFISCSFQICFMAMELKISKENFIAELSKIWDSSKEIPDLKKFVEDLAIKRMQKIANLMEAQAEN